MVLTWIYLKQSKHALYTHRPLDLLRMWHIKIEKWILTEAKVNFSDDGYDSVGLTLIDELPFVP